MYVMSCCHDLKRNKQFLCQKPPALFSNFCALKALISYTCLHPAASFRLSPLLRYLKDTLPCLCLGLCLSVDLRVSDYQLPKQLCVYNIMADGDLGVKQEDISTDLSFAFDSLEYV